MMTVSQTLFRNSAISLQSRQLPQSLAQHPKTIRQSPMSSLVESGNNLSHLSPCAPNPTWVANVSRLFAQSPWCITGESICKNDITNQIHQIKNLTVFNLKQRKDILEFFNKYLPEAGSSGEIARKRLIEHHNRQLLLDDIVKVALNPDQILRQEQQEAYPIAVKSMLESQPSACSTSKNLAAQTLSKNAISAVSCQPAFNQTPKMNNYPPAGYSNRPIFSAGCCTGPLGAQHSNNDSWYYKPFSDWGTLKERIERHRNQLITEKRFPIGAMPFPLLNKFSCLAQAISKICGCCDLIEKPATATTVMPADLDLGLTNHIIVSSSSNF
ncbi:MAG: hypothetical protein AB2992_04955 [Candidatus Symbiodolus clandestinus]